MNNETVPLLTIRPKSIVVYSALLHKKGKKEMSESQLANLEKVGKVNHIKTSTQSRLQKLLLNWIKSINYNREQLQGSDRLYARRIVFCTLTLPSVQEHSDVVVKRQVLSPFLQALKDKHSVINYFWKAEKQKNGNIHFHVLVDSYIDKDVLRHEWNHHLESLEYVTRFFKKHGHFDPPSTDVRLVDNSGKAIAYVLKYCMKGESAMRIEGRKWYTSRSLAEYVSVSYVLDSEAKEILDSLVKEEKLDVYQLEYATVLVFTSLFDYDIDYSRIAVIERARLLTIYDTIYNPDMSTRLVSDIGALVNNNVQPIQTSLNLGGYTVYDK